MPAPIAKAAIADGRLQSLLTRLAVTISDVFLCHPGNRQVLPKLRAFIDHVKNRSGDAGKVRTRRKPTASRGNTE